MVVDDSFKRPGAIPFKWEIRPGVPKVQQPDPTQQINKQQQQPLSPPTLPFPSPPFHPLKASTRTPPVSTHTYSPRTRSFRSASRIRSDRWRVEKPRQPECVSSPGCFPTSPISLRRKDSFRKGTNNSPLKITPEADDYYFSDHLETPSRYSVSSRRPPFSHSPLSSSSFSSYQSSPRFLRPIVVSHDPEWAGFGLF